ncbi:MAG: GGDEF domain-containing protein [Lachnospiraceae bacterium]|nr:GGDEF domain-containing protein [Lachnospiraceae bacterium]
MKKHETYKTIQLILFVVMTAGAVAMVFLDKDLYHRAATDPTVRMLVGFIWIMLLVMLGFIYLDFKYFLLYRKEYKELDLAIRSDPISGINNRFSCDLLIEKYLDKELPWDMGAIMIDITNIREINEKCGYVHGNNVIREFSRLLNDASEGLCFVGRNGGNKFLAIFEDTTKDKMDEFMRRLDAKLEERNAQSKEDEVRYRFGTAFHEGYNIQSITQLIALSNRRIGDPFAK